MIYPLTFSDAATQSHQTRFSQPSRRHLQKPTTTPFLPKTSQSPRFSGNFLRLNFYAGVLTFLSGFLGFNYHKHSPYTKGIHQFQDFLVQDITPKNLPPIQDGKFSGPRGEFLQYMYTLHAGLNQFNPQFMPDQKAVKPEEIELTQKILERYGNSRQDLTTCQKMYEEWSNAFLMPRIGIAETQKCQEAANQFFIAAKKSNRVENFLFAAVMLSIYVMGGTALSQVFLNARSAKKDAKELASEKKMPKN